MIRHNNKKQRRLADYPVCLVFLLLSVTAGLIVLSIMLVIPDGHIGGDATSADIEPRGSVVISENVAIPNDTPPGIADIDSDAQTIATMADLGTSLPGTSQSENPLSSPLPTDVEPDNDVDAETGEPIANVQAPAQGSTGGGDEAGLSSNLPAPLGPSVAPDNDVAVE